MSQESARLFFTALRTNAPWSINYRLDTASRRSQHTKLERRRNSTVKPQLLLTAFQWPWSCLSTVDRQLLHSPIHLLGRSTLYQRGNESTMYTWNIFSAISRVNHVINSCSPSFGTMPIGTSLTKSWGIGKWSSACHCNHCPVRSIALINMILSVLTKYWLSLHKVGRELT